ncbi:ribonuclease III [Geopsychrobacter electrodiphilus]|uniref:ribonuclease III n=1 Tax=Geopsychrobacter electrodiphilus TaxID=225196 RepID=UPI00035DC4B7|nr:ribonuclease III [Geopsychrobacter electrodiphilus]
MSEFLMEKLQLDLGYTFLNPDLPVQALTHKSYSNECRESDVGHNERLEFLGDAVLELAVSDLIYRMYPDIPEGGLTRIRAEVVCEKGLNRIAVRLNLGPGLRLGRGEEKCGGRSKASLLSDALEALIGAVFLEGGFLAACQLVKKVFTPDLERSANLRYGTDYKTALQENLQARFGRLPEYQLIQIDGPDHGRVFTIQVSFDGRELGCGEGSSKKQAEQNAASEALLHSFVVGLEEIDD